jgi:hypothetical protein
MSNRPVLISFVVVLVGLASCGSDDDSQRGPDEPLLAADCDPIGVHCGLPFPSDVYLRDDPRGVNPSGKSVRFGATTLPKVFGQMPIDPADYEDLDGWSVASSPTTYMPGATSSGLADPGELASTVDPESPTILLDTAARKLVPHFVDIDTSAAGAEKALMIRPAVILDDSTRYVVAIRRVVDASGQVLPPTDVFRALRDGTDHPDPSVASRRRHYRKIFADLEDAGVATDDLQIAWDFTSGSRESITGKMVAVRDAALGAVGALGPEYVIDEVIDDPNPMIRHRVIVTATVPRYLTEHVFRAGDPTPRLLFDESGRAMQNGTMEMEVLIQIPNSIDNGIAHGILQNGHGFFGSKTEGQNGYQAMAANGWNWINMAVDLFGFADPDLAMAAEGLLGRPELITGFFERQIQGHVNQLVAMRMMIGRIARDGIVDEAGRVLLAPEQVDASVRAYRGDSQGGIMGGVYMSISTDVTRGLLGEPAAAYSMIWQRSVDSDQFTEFIRPTYPSSPLDFQILLQLVQLHWDRAEPSGFVRAMHGDTLPDTPEHHVLMHAAIGDHEVPTIFAHSMARSIGAGLIRSDDPQQPFPRDVFGLDSVATPRRDESGLVEYEFALPPEPLTLLPATAGCNPHDRVRELTASFEQQDLFFRSGRIEWFCDGVCNCDGEREEDRCVESFEKECR